jgi:hypothetical protein
MRVVVVITRAHVSRGIAMLVEVCSIMIAIVAVAADDSYSGH